MVSEYEEVELSPFLQQLEDNRTAELTKRREMLAKALDQIKKWNDYKNQLFQHIDQLTPVFKEIIQHSVLNLGAPNKIIREGKENHQSDLFWRMSIRADGKNLEISLGQSNETINGQIESKSLKRINGLTTQYPWNSTKNYKSDITKEEKMLLDNDFLSSIRTFQRQVETLTRQLENARVIITLVAHQTSRTFFLRLDNFMKCDIVNSIQQLTIFLLTTTNDIWERMTKDMWWTLLVWLRMTSLIITPESETITSLGENKKLELDSHILDERTYCVDCRVILDLTHLKRCNTCQSERNQQIRRWFKKQMLSDSHIHAVLELLNKLQLNIEE